MALSLKQIVTPSVAHFTDKTTSDNLSALTALEVHLPDVSPEVCLAAGEILLGGSAMSDSTFANTNGSMPTNPVAVESNNNNQLRVLSDTTDAQGVRHVPIQTTAAGNDRETAERPTESLDPEHLSPVELAATPEDEDTPDPCSTLQKLTDEFLAKLQAAGLFEHCNTRKTEKFMMRLDSIVWTLLD